MFVVVVVLVLFCFPVDVFVVAFLVAFVLVFVLIFVVVFVVVCAVVFVVVFGLSLLCFICLLWLSL